MEVLSALEELGYRWAYRTIDALAFGIPQRRKRIFLFATLDGDPRDVLFHGDESPDGGERPLQESAHGFYWTEGNRGLGWGEDCVPTLKGGSTMGIPSPPAILMPDLAVVTPDLRDAERLQGLPADWTELEDQRDEPVSRSQRRRRWLLVGNAVNVEVSAWLGRMLAERSRSSDVCASEIREGQALPPAAWSDGKKRLAASVSTWPVAFARRPLAEFLHYPGSPLSMRATAGFYARICASTLRFKPGFKEAIASHLRKMQAQSQVSAIGTTRELATVEL